MSFFSGPKPNNKGGEQYKHSEPKSVKSSDDEEAEDIDKELGLDDLEGAEQMAAKDIDELLETWTNVGAEL